MESLYSLSTISPRDEMWKKYRCIAEILQTLYQDTIYSQYSKRIKECSRILKFSRHTNNNGEVRLKLKETWFCRVPLCPTCLWRKCLKQRAKVLNTLPLLLNNYPKSKFLYLTLTARNCELEDLRSTVNKLNTAWNKLTKRKEFSIQGWLKVLETTRNSIDNTLHSHFHCLLMVSPKYFVQFKNTYISI